MRELNSEIEIDASAERVWQLLTDLDRFPQWNPFIRSITGVQHRLAMFDTPYLKALSDTSSRHSVLPINDRFIFR